MIKINKTWIFALVVVLIAVLIFLYVTQKNDKAYPFPQSTQYLCKQLPELNFNSNQLRNTQTSESCTVSKASLDPKGIYTSANSEIGGNYDPINVTFKIIIPENCQNYLTNYKELTIGNNQEVYQCEGLAFI